MINILNMLTDSKKQFFYFAPILPFLFLFLMFLASCDDPSLYEFDSSAKRDSFDYHSGNDTSTIIIKTIRADSISSSEFSIDLLGTHKNDTFGITKTSIFTEFRLPSEAIDFGDTLNVTINSITLNLQYSGKDDYMGDISEEQVFNIYELNERIYRDSVYYSNVDIDYNSVSIGQWSGKFAPQDSIVIPIELSQPFLDKISNNLSIFDNEEAFIDFFKGIAIIPEGNVTEGAIIFFILENSLSNITILYNDSLEAVLPINNKCARIAKFEHDYTGFEAKKHFDNTTSKKLYLQPLAGMNINIQLPHIKNYITDGLVAVHRAELIFPIEETGLDTSNLPPQLLIYGLNKENEKVLIIDFFESHYGGKYNDQKTYYSFIITRQIQFLFQQFKDNPTYDDFNGLHMTIRSDKPIIANPLILKNFDNFNNQEVKLVLSYTVL